MFSLIAAIFSVSRSPMVLAGSLTNGWSSSTVSSKNLFKRPSTILSSTCSGLFAFFGSFFACARHVARFGRGDVHGDVFDKLLKLIGARDEIRLTVDFDQHTDLAAHVNVRADRAFGRDPPFLLLRRREAALAQDFNRLLFVATRFGERVLTLHHPRARLLSQRLHARCRNLCHDDRNSFDSC